ncbi:aldo/keto reductase [Halosolutus gelatinilyticus]|uniref:aldo/keto reductase n=1 Tax=Halosolutus gelatinilyticus TaxID=2931975 RepID=UPI001FF19FE2|nr:aldo/keto reductase [Halosolutus gelatinilyticus]
MESDESETFEIGGELTVRRLGFGAMSLGGSNNMHWPDDVDGAKRVLERAVDLGVDFVDTADMYGNGSSECVVGRTINVDRDDIVVATKGGILKQPDASTAVSGDPAYLKNAALRSRVRLETEVIDLYQLHTPDPDVPIEDSVTALAELKDEGLVRHVGLSNVDVEQLERARDVAEIATVQNYYNIANRDQEDVLSACEDAGIGFVPYSPIDKAALDGCEALDEVADAHDASRYQIALAWLLERSDVTIPIPGTSSLEHLEANVAAASIDLTDEQLARLDDAH